MKTCSKCDKEKEVEEVKEKAGSEMTDLIINLVDVEHHSDLAFEAALVTLMFGIHEYFPEQAEEWILETHKLVSRVVKGAQKKIYQEKDNQNKILHSKMCECDECKKR